MKKQISFQTEFSKTKVLLPNRLCNSLQTLQKIGILRVFSIKHNNLSKQEQKTLNGLLNKRAIDFIKGIIGMP